MLNDVKSSGAVSPAILAIESKIPVSIPVFAPLYTTWIITLYFGAPSAMAASLKLPGTSCNISSVVLSTIGTIITAKAAMPAQPLKCPVGSTRIA